MSGAPVRERDGDRVVGSSPAATTRPTAGSPRRVWIARCERLAALCEGIASIALADPAHPAAAIDLVPRDRRSRGAPDRAGRRRQRGAPRESGPGLANAVHDVRRARAIAGGSRATARRRSAAAGSARARTRRAAARRVLPAGADLAGAGRASSIARRPAHQPLRLGIAARRTLPDCRGRRCPTRAAERPLALRPLVSVHRRVAAAGRRRRCPGRCGSSSRSPRPTTAAAGARLRARAAQRADGGARGARRQTPKSASCRSRRPPQIRAALEVEPVARPAPVRATARREASCSSTTTAARARSTPTRSSTRRSRRAGCRRSSRSPPATRTRPTPTGEPVVRGAALPSAARRWSSRARRR